MRLSQDKGYASFGRSTTVKDPYVAALESAFNDGLALRQEGRKLNLAHVPQSLRMSFKAGYLSI